MPTFAAIESLRDQRYRRTPALQVKSIPAALDFINDVGFCFAFSPGNAELPCLWHAACGTRQPVMPEHTHHDPYISLVWEAKDVLPAQQQVYYGKIFKKRPGFIALEYFPYFYRLIANERSDDSYLQQYFDGELAASAKRILEALYENSPQVTHDLKSASGMSHPRQRYQFDQAMTELQMKMYILKIAEFYEPFTFLWELVPRRFPQVVSQAGSISPEVARRVVLQQYLENVIAVTTKQIQQLFAWPPAQVEECLEMLIAGSQLTPPTRLADKAGEWYILNSLL